MATKRLKNNHDQLNENCQMSVDDKILSSDISSSFPLTSTSNSFPYHTSKCGSILYSSPSNSPADIFKYLRHNDFEAFRRSLDVYYNEIILMKNEYGQTVLHVLVIHAYPYLWTRLMMMRGCDPCAQDFDGYTAAHYTVERDDVEMLKALTVRFHSQVRPIAEAQIENTHRECLRALTLKTSQGLTVFMLACHHESLKCLNYLIELNVNDVNLEDQFGDTCLQYAVARRHYAIVEKLITVCKANVNGGNPTRPSALDIIQHNREQQKPSEQAKDDGIEQLLLNHHARHRCTIRRVINKRKGPSDTDDAVVSNLACLSIDFPGNADLETARSHARLAATAHERGDEPSAEQNYKQAVMYTPTGTLEWTTYACRLADIYAARGNHSLALDLLQRAIDIRKQLENNSQEINQIQQTIDRIRSSISD